MRTSASNWMQSARVQLHLERVSDATVVERALNACLLDFISALIGRRGAAPDLVMRAFVYDRIEVVASSLLLAELELVLRHPKLAVYADERTARGFIERIRTSSTSPSSGRR